MGFDAPTPIQSQAVPAILGHRDLLATAPTGSGKTLAYALPVLQLLMTPSGAGPRRIRALVLVPTRELAAQVGETLRRLAQGLRQPLRVAVVFGGVSINPQMMGLRGGADVLVATPGRLLDLVSQNALRLSAVQTLVLDEADRLLDLGFADELDQVLALLPATRQNLFFSATCPPMVEALAATRLNDPLRLELHGPQADAPSIEQQALQVDEARRAQLLLHLIKTRGWQRVLVFVATQYAAVHVATKLQRAGLFVTPFHGAMSQGARQQVLQAFKDDRFDVVVTTDLAARGIDIAQLPVVVNYDLPRSAVDYVHRIGRTGRAGESGLAVSFVCAHNLAHWRLIEKRQRLSLPLEVVPGFEPVDAPALVAANGTGGIKGKRPSKKDKLRAAAARLGTE